jgi:hypothetical protein
MPRPIFIVGNQRSGTTWLANVLCLHSKIAGVQGEPTGIRESKYFNIIEGFFGDLKDDNNFIQFIETFGSTDYFRLTNVEKDLLYKKRPNTYVQVFRFLMNTYANKQNALYWLEKSPGHTLFLNKLSKYFKDAKFIGIKRNIIDTIKSEVRRTVIRNNMIKKYYILRRSLHHYKYVKHLDKFASVSNKILIINYGDLLKDKKDTIKKLCNFLDLEYEDSQLKDRYRPNTSFTNFNNQEERAKILTSFEIKMINFVSFILKLLPYRFYRTLYFFQLNTRKRTLHPKTWDDFKREKFKKYSE